MRTNLTRREWLKLSSVTSVGIAAGLGGPYVRRTAAQDKGPIRIGFPVPLSGIYGDYANDQVNGAQLAVDEWNAKGGVLGRKVELLKRDDQLQVDVITRPSYSGQMISRALSLRISTIFVCLAKNSFACR